MTGQELQQEQLLLETEEPLYRRYATSEAIHGLHQAEFRP